MATCPNRKCICHLQSQNRCDHIYFCCVNVLLLTVIASCSISVQNYNGNGCHISTPLSLNTTNRMTFTVWLRVWLIVMYIAYCVNKVESTLYVAHNYIPYFLEYVPGLEYIHVSNYFLGQYPILKSIIPRGYIWGNTVVTTQCFYLAAHNWSEWFFSIGIRMHLRHAEAKLPASVTSKIMLDNMKICEIMFRHWYFYTQWVSSA